MGYEIASGICGTTITTAQATYVWNVEEQGPNLLVVVEFGGGTATDNRGTAKIPVGSTAAVPVVTNNNPNINVVGSVSAIWSDNNNNYVIVFNGQMVRGNVVNIFSSSMAGVPEDQFPIIVFAYLN
jgi:hypothetical protein